MRPYFSIYAPAEANEHILTTKLEIFGTRG